MVREAGTLKSLDELNLSEKALECINKKGLSLEDVVTIGRKFFLYPDTQKRAKKWEQELSNALDEAGFIRHELYPMTYRVWNFYYSLPRLPKDKEKVRSNPLTAPNDPRGQGYVGNILSADLYENVSIVTDIELNAILKAMDKPLFGKRKEITVMYFGLNGGPQLNMAEIGKILGLSRSRVHVLKNESLRRICWREPLSEMPSLFGWKAPNREPWGLEDYLKIATPLSPEDRISDLPHTGGIPVRHLYDQGYRIIQDLLDNPKPKYLKDEEIRILVANMRAVGFTDFSIDY